MKGDLDGPAAPPTQALLEDTARRGVRYLADLGERAVQASLTTEQVLAILADPAYWQKPAAAG
jgi:hypothetical protein